MYFVDFNCVTEEGTVTALVEHSPEGTPTAVGTRVWACGDEMRCQAEIVGYEAGGKLVVLKLDMDTVEDLVDSTTRPA